MNLFQFGDFTLASGAFSRWKIDCDALSDGDIEVLAALVAKVAGPFSSVEVVPKGGLRLAEAVRRYQCAITLYSHLIVDDVLTTGGSMNKLREKRIEESKKEGRVIQGVKGVVLFARGPCPTWVRALLQLPSELWLEGSDVIHE